ncbi:MAG: peptide-methionine (S)-S-oxide reductase MsrA [Opitutales bacterium]
MKISSISIALVTFGLFGCVAQTEVGPKSAPTDSLETWEAAHQSEVEGLETAFFASGCFWCTETVFERVAGVETVLSGYIGGPEKRPAYHDVAYGRTGHAEAVAVYYDPDEVSYEELLTYFFASHDPTQVDRQGPDVGPQYRSGIFYRNDRQKELATGKKQALNNSGKYDRPIATEITPAGTFWVAEAYHQGFYERNPNHPYIRSVSRPKVEKFEREYADALKPRYRDE